MKRSKRYIRNSQNKKLINQKVLQNIIAHSDICQHAMKELKIAGYGKGDGGPNDRMYKQVMEAIAVFASHGNSYNSAPFEINLVKKLCSWNVISPLRFTDDEWLPISKTGVWQNKRKYDVFKDCYGDIYYNGAFTKRPTDRYNYATKEWTENKNPLCWNGGLFEHKDNVLTGRYFKKCILGRYEVGNGWMPKETQPINCVEIEINPNNFIMAVDADSNDLLLLSCKYVIAWRECPCMKGIRLEDVTPELEAKAYEETKTDEKKLMNYGYSRYCRSI